MTNRESGREDLSEEATSSDEEISDTEYWQSGENKGVDRHVGADPGIATTESSGESDVVESGSHWLTRIAFLRMITFIYFVAFLVAYHQNKQLIGDRGLLPLKLYMEELKKSTGVDWWRKIVVAPTLLWLAEPWDHVNEWLDNISLAGLTLSGLVMISGGANVFIMLTLWVLYHSLVNVGQRWYGFGWESQLLETGLLAAWGVPLFNISPLPRSCPTPWVMIYGLRWLLFRIMLGAGLIKIRGDKCWHDLTCMNYHYETQPMPSPLSYYLHQLPEWWHKTETLGNHIVELAIPFFAGLPRTFQIWCGILQILFQVMLIISGNLSFLNWLTIVPSIAFFDDKTLSIFFTKSTRKKVVHLQKLQKTQPALVTEGHTRKMFNVGIAVIIGYLSLPVVINLLSARQAMNTSFDPLRIVNTYGAFGSVTKKRTEVIFEGTYADNPNDALAQWEEYEFKCKPGNVSNTPCLISPYHFRLDWLMWFAAFQRYEHNPWLVHLAGKFLVNDEEVSSLISHNPFLGRSPPKFVRAQHYKYQYAPVGSKSAKRGQWYKRQLIGPYLPPVSIDSLRPVFDRMRWPTLHNAGRA